MYVFIIETESIWFVQRLIRFTGLSEYSFFSVAELKAEVFELRSYIVMQDTSGNTLSVSSHSWFRLAFYLQLISICVPVQMSQASYM